MCKLDMKEAFIQYRLSQNRKFSVSSVVAIFDFASAYEQKLGKDLAFFTEDEALEMLKARESRSLSSLQNTVTTLGQYASFVFNEQGISAENSYKSISKNKLEECISTLADKALLTREQIDSLQNRMINAIDKAILECLFIGISGKNLTDLTYLEAKHLDIESKTVTLESGKFLNLTNRQVSLLVDAFNETENISYLKGGQKSSVTGVGRLYKQKINASSTDSSDKRFRWVLRRVMIWREVFGQEVLTMKSIAMSGLVHELEQGMQETGFDLRSYLKSSAGTALAERFDYSTKSAYHVDVIVNRVQQYFKKG